MNLVELQKIDLIAEIEAILRNKLKKLLEERRVEKFAYRLFDTLGALVKRIDLETYWTFSAIVLDEGPELEDSFSDVSPDDKSSLRELAANFFEVFSVAVSLTADVQRLRSIKR